MSIVANIRAPWLCVYTLIAQTSLFGLWQPDRPEAVSSTTEFRRFSSTSRAYLPISTGIILTPPFMNITRPGTEPVPYESIDTHWPPYQPLFGPQASVSPHKPPFLHELLMSKAADSKNKSCSPEPLLGPSSLPGSELLGLGNNFYQTTASIFPTNFLSDNGLSLQPADSPHADHSFPLRAANSIPPFGGGSAGISPFGGGSAGILPDCGSLRGSSSLIYDLAIYTGLRSTYFAGTKWRGKGSLTQPLTSSIFDALGSTACIYVLTMAISTLVLIANVCIFVRHCLFPAIGNLGTFSVIAMFRSLRILIILLAISGALASHSIVMVATISGARLLLHHSDGHLRRARLSLCIHDGSAPNALRSRVDLVTSRHVALYRLQCCPNPALGPLHTSGDCIIHCRSHAPLLRDHALVDDGSLPVVSRPTERLLRFIRCQVARALGRPRLLVAGVFAPGFTSSVPGAYCTCVRERETLCGR